MRNCNMILTKEQITTIEDQKEIKAIEGHRKQLVESNELIKKDFNIDKDSILLEEQKKYLMNLLKKYLLDLRIYKKRINSNNLIYK